MNNLTYKFFQNLLFRFPEVAVNFRLKDLMSTMKRERRKNVPPTPRTMEELGPILDNYPPVNTIYRGSITSADGGYGLFFMTPEMENPLSQSNQLFADGTFKVCNSHKILFLYCNFKIALMSLDFGFHTEKYTILT